MINRVGKICVAAMSLCMIVLIVTNKLLLSESAVSYILRVKSVSFTSRLRDVLNSFLTAVWCPFHIQSAFSQRKPFVILSMSNSQSCQVVLADLPVSDLIIKLYVVSTCLQQLLPFEADKSVNFMQYSTKMTYILLILCIQFKCCNNL